MQSEYKCPVCTQKITETELSKLSLVKDLFNGLKLNEKNNVEFEICETSVKTKSNGKSEIKIILREK